jgi:uncharacterized protein YdhG (YjbR/CyaY superfamily)
MPDTSGDRSAHFPAIEKKYGQPMSYWFDQMEQVSGKKYPEQIAYLRGNHGFTQAHANALVLYSRGSTTSRRFNNFEEFLAPLEPIKQETIREIFDVLTAKYPKMKLVIAWNQPMLKYQDAYVFGVYVSKNHITIAPWNAEIVDEFRPRLTDYTVNKKTIQVPVDWKVDKKLLRDMITAQVKSLP